METTIQPFATYAVDPPMDSLYTETQDFAPITMAMVKLVQGSMKNSKPFLCLLDSSSTTSWITKSSIPTGIHGKRVLHITSNTIAGDFSSNEKVLLSHIKLPEFFYTNPSIKLLLMSSILLVTTI